MIKQHGIMGNLAFSRCFRIVVICSGEYDFRASASTSLKKLYRFDLASGPRGAGGEGFTLSVSDGPRASKLTWGGGRLSETDYSSDSRCILPGVLY